MAFDFYTNYAVANVKVATQCNYSSQGLIIDISLYFVCMNALISATIIAGHTKFETYVPVNYTQVVTILNLACHAHRLLNLRISIS